MLISLNWLKEYIDLDNLEINELENALTMIGQEVEHIDIKGKNLENIVVGQIIEKGVHPDSEHLTLCKVDNGQEIVQIICGAPNHKQGDKVVVANIGAELSEDFKIKKTKIRGVESFGMLCSEKELGIGEDHEGIMILPSDAEVGQPIKEYLNANDVIFELEITPNRPDCLSHLGIARELAVYYNKDLKMPNTKIIDESSEKTVDEISINIENKDISKRYTARIVKGVEIKESPKWLKERLNSIGIRSINNIVDITNFVLMEMNHPIHAFDLDKIDGRKIVVRNAKENEKIVTLDNQERELVSEDIVIGDANKGIALAGVMGGSNSEIDEKTKNVLIEVAHFNPVNIRQTSKRLGLSSDASYRFERGVDVEQTEKVVNRVANLIKELAGGTILLGVSDEYVDKYKNKEITFDTNRFNKFVGKIIPKQEVINIFEKLEIKVEDKGEELILTPPSFREDLEREADFYEEIIRIYGFDNIESIYPKININLSDQLDTIKNIDIVKDIVSNLGLREVINYSFIPENGLDKINYKIENKLMLKNPINEDMVLMRPTLIYSLLKNIRDNFNRNFYDLKIFEVSRTFLPGDKLAKEEEVLGIAIGGREEKSLWNAKPDSYDFYYLKGIITAIFEKLSFNSYQLVRSENQTFHPGRSADILVGKEKIGSFGEIHPIVLENMEIDKERILVAEISLDNLKKYTKSNLNYKGINKFPEVTRDFAFVMDEDVLVGDFVKMIEKSSNIIEKVNLFDIYRGEGVEEGKKSVAINVILRDNKTLEEETINKVVNDILDKAKTKYEAVLR